MFLSIIIPIYNCEKYLEECLVSCLRQDISDYEIICINDGSMDRSVEIVKGFQKKYPNILLFEQQNSGVSKARNYGLYMARGEYVWFVDSDDFISDNILGIIKASVLENGYDRIKLQSYCFEEKLNEEEVDLKIKNLLKSNYPYKNTQITRTILKTKYIKENQIWFYEALKYGEDTIFNYETRIYCPKDLELKIVAYYYRKHMQATTYLQSDEKKINYIKSAYAALGIVINNYNLRKAYRESRDMILYWINVLLEQYAQLSQTEFESSYRWNFKISIRLCDVKLYYFVWICNFFDKFHNYNRLRKWNDKKQRNLTKKRSFYKNLRCIKGMIMHPKRIGVFMKKRWSRNE